MKKIFKLILFSVGLMAFFVLSAVTLAASPATDNLKFVGETGNTAPYVASDQYKMAEIIGAVIQALLSLLGVLFLVYTLYAGYNWMVAQGDEEKVTKAKDTIQRAVIGLIITIAAYAISYWVFGRLLSYTNIVT